MTLQEVIDGLDHEVEKRALRLSEGPQRGMKVPDNGDFVSATPSMISRLRWWVRELKAAAAREVGK